MKEACRICARELCGNQRRWIFHPAAKLNLQVLLSHALGRELTRDGRGEFACGKCAFMLDRMYRFDTVIARVEALSVERLQRLLQEKDRLRQCIAGLYRKHNGDELPNGAAQLSGKDCTVDMSGLHHAKYCALLQEDLVYSVYESWAEEEEQTLAECAHHQCHHAPSELSAGHRPRQRCRGCSALRVADSDYEAVCRVPRKLARSTSCGPSTRYSSASGPADAELTSDSERTLLGRGSSSPSMESLDTAVDAPHSPVQTGESEGDGDVRDDGNSDSLSEERVRVSAPASKMALALCLLQTCSYHPVQIQLGSRLPVLVRPNPRKTGIKMVSPERALRTTVCVGGDCELTEVEPPPPCVQLDFGQDMVELEEMWHDDYVEYMPFRFQKKLQEKLSEMECELRSIRQAAQNQERTIQGLNESVTTKDNEAQELYKLIEGQNATLCKLREIAHRNQLQQMQVHNGGGVTQLQAELVALQGSLFSVQLELEASQRAHRQSQRQAEDQSRAAQRLNNDLQEALQHREATEKHSQDLRNVLQQSRSELQMKDTQLKDMEADKLSVLQQRDNTITQLRLSLQDKDRLLQEYSEMLDPPADSGRPRDALLDKLRSRIRDRDRALERSIDEKFQCLEEKEEETRRLHQALREKERDLERLRTILTNNEETITSLDALVRGKELELEHTQESCRKVQSLKQESEEKHTLILRERDHLITQLQTALHTHSKETEDLRAALLSKVCVSPSEVVEELKARLQLKEHLLQELLSDRSRQAQEHQALTHNLISTISSRDQYIKDSADRLGQVICERTGQAQELRRQLLSRERELGELSREREKERENVAPITREMERLQKLLKEKEAFIQVTHNTHVQTHKRTLYCSCKRTIQKEVL
uniref:Short myomegalin-like EB1 binding protein N-terminal domain-containing protein n=1 Tax=Denticeps clupeoides TaxID=299321 RepID=A0AAY4EFB2_9TELE